MDDTLWEEIRGAVQQVKTRMSVTSITCARTVRGRAGDEYIAMTVGIDSVKDEAPVERGRPVQGIPLRESRLAAYLLAMQVDIAAHEHALASGTITKDYCDKAIKMIKANHARLLEQEFGGRRDRQHQSQS